MVRREEAVYTILKIMGVAVAIAAIVKLVVSKTTICLDVTCSKRGAHQRGRRRRCVNNGCDPAMLKRSIKLSIPGIISLLLVGAALYGYQAMNLPGGDLKDRAESQFAKIVRQSDAAFQTMCDQGLNAITDLANIIPSSPAPSGDSHIPETSRSPAQAKNGLVQTTFTDGSLYTGRMKDGLPDGIGRLSFPDSDSYFEGWFSKGHQVYGTLALPENRYTGMFAPDLAFNAYVYEGYGMLISNGDTQTGIWERNQYRKPSLKKDGDVRAMIVFSYLSMDLPYPNDEVIGEWEKSKGAAWKSVKDLVRSHAIYLKTNAVSTLTDNEIREQLERAFLEHVGFLPSETELRYDTILIKMGRASIDEIMKGEKQAEWTREGHHAREEAQSSRAIRKQFGVAPHRGASGAGAHAMPSAGVKVGSDPIPPQNPALSGKHVR